MPLPVMGERTPLDLVAQKMFTRAARADTLTDSNASGGVGYGFSMRDISFGDVVGAVGVDFVAVILAFLAFGVDVAVLVAVCLIGLDVACDDVTAGLDVARTGVVVAVGAVGGNSPTGSV